MDVLKIDFADFGELDTQPFIVLNQVFPSTHVGLINVHEFLVVYVVLNDRVTETESLLVIELNFLDLEFQSFMEQFIGLIELFNNFGYFVSC